MKIVLAGQYRNGTAEKLRKLLPENFGELVPVTDEAEFKKITDADILVLRIFKADRAFIEQNKNLKLILRWGVGYDTVDIQAAGEHGIYVTNTPGANSDAVSELTIMHMLAVCRKLLCYTENINAGNWKPNVYENQAFCLYGKTIGIIGCGNIGSRVARKVRVFGAETQYFDVVRLSEEREKELGIRFVSLEELLKTSDIVTLHCPLFEDNYHMIGKDEIAMMKDGAVLINCARGGLVDDDELLKAVESGKLKGAGMDVPETVPLPLDSPLLRNPNIVITPHIGGSSSDVADIIIPMLASDISLFLKGERPVNVVNAQYLK